MITRRSFFVGVGSIVTAAFVARVTDHVQTLSRPLLIAPKAAEETLFAYPGMTGDGDGRILTLGPLRDEPPDDITWRQYLEARGERVERLSDYRRLWRDQWLTPREVNGPMEPQALVTAWDLTLSPAAKAFNLLKSLDIGPALSSRADKAGRLTFMDMPHPGSSERWVEAKGDLAVSLLQARLVELGLPIKVVVGDPADI